MKGWSASLAIVSALLLVGCERPHSDMGEQDKYKTYQPSEFFADGASARPLVAGTVPRERSAPTTLPVTDETIAHGQQSFDTFCSPCHGRLGNGEGMIVQRGFTRPPSYHIDRLRNAPDAHFYDVITNGYGAMFSYSERVPPQERWEIISYIRVLQTAGARAPAEVRAALIAQGDRKTPTAGGGG